MVQGFDSVGGVVVERLVESLVVPLVVLIGRVG